MTTLLACPPCIYSPSVTFHPQVWTASHTNVLFLGRTPFYAVSVNGLHRDSGRVRVSVRVGHRVRVRACRPYSSGNLLTRRKMEFAPVS